MALTTPPITPQTALLICDVQQGFIWTPTAHLPAAATALQMRYPLSIATRFYNAPQSAFRTLMNWPRFARDSEEYALAFTPDEKTVIIDKPGYSCVNDTFLSHLKDHDIDTVHIVGCDTNMCISVCAIDLFQTNHIRPVVLLPYCASHSGVEYHDSAVRLLEKSIGAAQLWHGPPQETGASS